ncbi:hypothetical protein F442_08172 [Phytophthora nicotianae P10297]|uniref:Uncharacterized protein n=1 Tax=Phytophthora nicotianae P10297 TaxID=1317064 RepID=W2ZEJ4_PHYNI|nr:hypothetical protein F442_08172 [Phytophthora nicotianae P10297]
MLLSRRIMDGRLLREHVQCYLKNAIEALGAMQNIFWSSGDPYGAALTCAPPASDLHDGRAIVEKLEKITKHTATRAEILVPLSLIMAVRVGGIGGFWLCERPK